MESTTYDIRHTTYRLYHVSSVQRRDQTPHPFTFLPLPYTCIHVGGSGGWRKYFTVAMSEQFDQVGSYVLCLMSYVLAWDNTSLCDLRSVLYCRFYLQIIPHTPHIPHIPRHTSHTSHPPYSADLRTADGRQWAEIRLRTRCKGRRCRPLSQSAEQRAQSVERRV
jgi:hypothetical protein